MPDIINYKEEVKRLISETYESADIINKEFQFTTIQLTNLLMTILPYKAIDEHLVYEALLELGFQPKEESPLEFYWYFKRK
ncbi:hypothetical protein G6N05_05455 [Flavobacterium sp. F372]|uniref:Uncharacterized protein n=1 Tax=Flavobacterium bernardetii TaxID=2813823 RepID=A0ABR7J1N6_9FLAO|nr:hypothetical protein [Flavobacterium bernardetii]MBC5835827.1 hypothetical protein [Flavobacterium bernardetii]NHF69557.1 hypothetical protein [Flavobacterium bernardetii]